MSRFLTRRRLLLGAAALAALPGLSACGKRARVRLPDEKRGEATYPRQYPPPDSVNPGATAPDSGPAPAPSDPQEGDPYYDPFADDEEDTVRDPLSQ